MSKTIAGSIPKEITYVYKPLISCRIGGYDTLNKKEVKLHPTFPVETGNKKSLETTGKWATSYNQKNYSTENIDNSSIKNVKVISLEHRGQGGRAYKIQIDKFLFDLREDVLVDIMLEVGIQPGGILNGEYTWAKIGSQTKLIRIGSDLHKMISSYKDVKDTKPVSKNNLEIGGVYKDRKGYNYIFLGHVNTTALKATDRDLPDFAMNERSNIYYNDSTKASLKFKSVFDKNAMLFIKTYNGNYNSYLDKAINPKTQYVLEIKKSHSLISKVDTIKIPENFISKIRDINLISVKNMIGEFVKQVPTLGFSNPRISSWRLQEDIEHFSKYLNMYSVDESPVKIFDPSIYITFS